MRTIVVSFQTTESYYREAADRLRADCATIGIDCNIVEIVPNPEDTWVDICRRKVPFLLEMHRKHQRPILWLDVDSRLGRYPDVLDGATCDFAAFLRGERYLRGFDPFGLPRFFAPFALFFNATPRARAFLELMADLERRFEGTATDDFFLQEAWERHEEQLSVMVLPPDLVSREWPLSGSQMIHIGVSGNVSKHKAQAEQHGVPLLTPARRQAVLLREASEMVREGRADEAITFYMRALEVSPPDDALVEKVARLLRRAGKADEAERVLRRYERKGSEEN